MKKLRLTVILMALLLVFVLPATAVYAALTSKDIEKELMCQCGCSMIVDVCDCETATQIRARIAELIGQGQDKDQIIASFVGQYGEKMLAAPTKKGFNLVAWVVPFAAVVAGGTGLFFLLRAWARKGKAAGTGEPVVFGGPVTVPEADLYRGRLQDELKKFKEGPA
jgi:cytochrome c-type biogenesis protein CcmH